MEQEMAEASGNGAVLHGVEVDRGGVDDAEGVAPETIISCLETLPTGQQLPPLELEDDSADAYTAPETAAPPPSDIQLAEEAATAMPGSSDAEVSDSEEDESDAA
eukprot:scaffold292900_cov17-Tisochrysis_lutea.AAC.1